jgi:hypothetical protein
MYSHVQEMFDSFPKTILLVGNGKLDKVGELIDSYECVIRFNDFEIEGYEELAGTKISAISFHSNNLDKNHIKYLKNNYEKYVNKFPIFTLSSSVPNEDYNIITLQKGTKLLAVHPALRLDPPVRLSSGGAVALTLTLFFDKNVHMIGFDFMKTGHYYNESVTHTETHIRSNEEQMLPKIKGITIL